MKITYQEKIEINVFIKTNVASWPPFRLRL